MNKSIILSNNLVYNNSISPTHALQEQFLDEPTSRLTYNSSSISQNYVIDSIDVPKVMISSSKEITIPLTILKNNSSLQAIVYYLREVCNLRFNEIALLLNRDQRTVWVTYANFKKKNKTDLASNTNISISASAMDYHISLPLNLFTSRTFSVLETIVFYLRTNYDLSFNQISEILGKNYRTIWTVYRRALRKLRKKTSEKNGVELSNK